MIVNVYLPALKALANGITSFLEKAQDSHSMRRIRISSPSGNLCRVRFISKFPSEQVGHLTDCISGKLYFSCKEVLVSRVFPIFIHQYEFQAKLGIEV
jgi:hypothetical protein